MRYTLHLLLQKTDKHRINILVLPAPVTPFLPLPGGVRGPQREVVPQELHDQSTVLITVLVQGVQLGNSVVKSLNKENYK